MDAFLMAVWVAVVQTAPISSPAVAPVSNAVVAPPIIAPQVAPVKASPTGARCDARPYQRLVGRTISDLLTARLPQGARIYRIDDPQIRTIEPGRLSVELNRSTRVRRVYCS